MLQLVDKPRSPPCRPDRSAGVPVSYRHSIPRSAQLVDALDMFQAHPQMRMLPVIDADKRPVGAIFEQDMRLILFNPFGHALLKNPSYGAHLEGHICQCPTVDIHASTEMLIDTFASVKGHGEGLIVTRQGRYCGVIDNVVLLQLAAARDAEAALQKAARFQRLEEASDSFRNDLTKLATALGVISRQLSGTAERTAQRAAANGDRAAEVAAAASQAATNMSEVASRGNSLAQTLQGVERKVSEAQTATREAAACATRNISQTHLLSAAAQEIGNVVSLIDGIARTTTMLALNAAIEAARAGEPGKGFAVVAGEVKSLAQQTRHAAADISERVRNIQAATGQVSEGHVRIGDAISIVEELSSSVVTAVVEQGAAIRAIAANVEEASEATDHIHVNAEDIHQNGLAAASGAAAIQQHAQALSAQARSVQDRLTQFLDIVRTS